MSKVFDDKPPYKATYNTNECKKLIRCRDNVYCAKGSWYFPEHCGKKCECYEIEDRYMANDVVKNPSHYCFSKYEPKDVIREWNLNFNLGNCIKYVARAGKKDDIVQDLKKAKQYLEFEIEFLEKQREKTCETKEKYENYGEMYPPSQIITKIE